MYIDFNRSFIEWETKDNSKGRFALDAVLKSETNFYSLGSKVLACNVYNNSDFFKQPIYSFQAILSDNDYSIFRIYTESLNQGHTLNENLNDFNNFKKHIVVLSDYNEITNFEELVKNYNQNKKFQAYVKWNNREFQFPVKHININESLNMFQVETGEVLIQNNSKIVKAYITFSSFNYAELLIENEKNEKHFFNERLNIHSEIKIIAS